MSTSPASAATTSRSFLGLVLDGLGSMRLTVWLLVLLALLTWLGTLAQIDASTYDVQREYFESWFVLAELPLSVWGNAIGGAPEGSGFPLRFPLPGAYPVMALLFVNLVVGGMLRLRWTRRNTGVLITHLGMLLLLLAGFVKLETGYSGMLGLYERGGAGGDRVHESSTFVSFHDYELALLTDKGDTIVERVVPAADLQAAHGSGSVTLAPEGLPFKVQVHHWIDHSQVVTKGAETPATPVVGGLYLHELSWRPGEQPKKESEIAGCYVSVFGDGGERFDAILWGYPRAPENRSNYVAAFTIKGQRYALDLRRATYDLPFAVRLDKFEKKDHPGTMSPRDFRSHVTVTEQGQSTEAQIFMNNPLRRAGFVLYQASWGQQPMGGPPYYTVLEVANNPSDAWPEYACYIIALGLLWHFGAKLLRFLNSSTRTSLLRHDA
ncbi:MAG: cytochrome c biogenesis protein ResB [Planctomycetes bacterium]|nr:cytochrome c biogenesis protein ResB [Planctomycetota bacterium]